MEKEAGMSKCQEEEKKAKSKKNLVFGRSSSTLEATEVFSNWNDNL